MRLHSTESPRHTIRSIEFRGENLDQRLERLSEDGSVTTVVSGATPHVRIGAAVLFYRHDEDGKFERTSTIVNITRESDTVFLLQTQSGSVYRLTLCAGEACMETEGAAEQERPLDNMKTMRLSVREWLSKILRFSSRTAPPR